MFLIITSKFQLQIHYTLEVMAENVPVSGIGPYTNFDFLMYFHK